MLEELLAKGEVQEIPAGTTVLENGSYIRSIVPAGHLTQVLQNYMPQQTA